jgi:hypothetical protein
MEFNLAFEGLTEQSWCNEVRKQPHVFRNKDNKTASIIAPYSQLHNDTHTHPVSKVPACTSAKLLTVHFYTTLHTLLMGQNIHITCPLSCYCMFPVHMDVSWPGLSCRNVRILGSVGSVKWCNSNDWKQANHQNLQSCLLFARPSPRHQTRKCRLRVLAYAMQQEQITVPPVARNALIYTACRQTHMRARARPHSRMRAHTHTPERNSFNCFKFSHSCV